MTLACLDAEEAAGFAYGWLAEEQRTRVEVHIDACAQCRKYVTALLAASEPTEHSTVMRAAGREDIVLARGTSVGRYVIDGMLGVGGMGVVYAGYDSKLDRKVALKMVRVDQPSGRDRLEREAQAMARLSHRNVVTIYDIGVHEDRLFLAMEFIEGVTLRSWLTREERLMRDVVQAFVQAGRGLAAAHHNGLLHRDFKPDNVLCELGGRVCVTDFGLARTMALPEENVGVIAGTPAYMAPEQYLGQALDARSDQFSFCVALYEALYHQRPFAGSRVSELRDAITQGRIREVPTRTAVSVRVQKAIWRGLSVDPAKRHGSMDDLLDLLTYDPRARRRRLVLGGAAAAITLVAAISAYRYVESKSVPICRQFERKLDGAWDAPKKKSVREALLATGKPFAGDAWKGVERALDAYAASWISARTEACEATHVRGDQSPLLLDLRMACLDDRLREMNALVDVLARADAPVAGKSVAAAQSLTTVASCSNTRVLLARGKASDEVESAEVAPLRAELAAVKALRQAGKYSDGATRAHAVLTKAESLNARGFVGEALLQYGDLQRLTGSVNEAETTLRRSISSADAVGDDATRARAWTALLYAVNCVQGKHELTQLMNDQAAAAIARMGGDGPLEGARRYNLAFALRCEGRYADAIREFQDAIPVLQKALGQTALEVLRCRHGLGETLAIQGDLDGAWKTLKENAELVESSLGPSHPLLAAHLHGFGLVLMNQLRLSEARAPLDRALHIMEEAEGASYPVLSPYLGGVGSLALEMGQPDRAISYFRRSLDVLAKSDAHSVYSRLYPLAGLGEAYLELGETGQAIESLERALLTGGNAEAELDLARARFALARASWTRDAPRARSLANEALAAHRKSARSPLELRNQERIEQWLARRR